MAWWSVLCLCVCGNRGRWRLTSCVISNGTWSLLSALIASRRFPVDRMGPKILRTGPVRLLSRRRRPMFSGSWVLGADAETFRVVRDLAWVGSHVIVGPGKVEETLLYGKERSRCVILFLVPTVTSSTAMVIQI